MIEHALSLATASGSGAILGLIGNMIASSVEKERIRAEGYRKANQEEREAIHEHSKNFKVSEAHRVVRKFKLGSFEWAHEYTKAPRAINPPFSTDVLLITICYCICTITCFLLGDLVVATQNPTAEPTITSWGWGFYRSEHNDDTISVVTFASVGAYMAHFLAFILSAVITGVVPKKGRG